MKRYGSMLLCLIAALALVAMAAMPALAHHKDGHEEGTPTEADSRQDQQEASSDDTASNGSSSQRSPNESSSKESSSSSNKSSSKESSSTASSSTAEPTEDPEGKRYDGEGEPRGETADECTNTHEGNFSGSGANRHGPYDSTCDGSASLAGNGGGSATGRPCAGCVGNADNKNPKGQYPDGNHDGNAGYECDANNGVGRSNPAHTGCQPPPALLPDEVLPSKVCPPGTDLAGQPMDTLADCSVDVLSDEIAPAKVCPEGTARAGEEMDTLADCDDVLGLVIRRAKPQVRSAAPAVKGAVLPFTGAGDAYFATALSMLLIALGAVAMRLRREEA